MGKQSRSRRSGTLVTLLVLVTLVAGSFAWLPTLAQENPPTEVPAAIPTEIPPTDVPATDEPPPDPTDEPAPDPTDVPQVIPTDEPPPVPTDEPIPDPTDEPPPVPTDEPTEAPTVFPVSPTATEFGAIEVGDLGGLTVSIEYLGQPPSANGAACRFTQVLISVDGGEDKYLSNMGSLCDSVTSQNIRAGEYRLRLAYYFGDDSALFRKYP